MNLQQEETLSSRRKYFEIATLVWAIVLVVLATVHLTASPAYASVSSDGWVDCGDSCAVFCGMFNSGCERIWEWWGCGCTIWCSNGLSVDVLCF
jgi:hypothetical protein